MYRVVVLGCLLAACGRIDFDPRSDDLPIGVAVPLAQVNSMVADDDPTLTGDLLEIMFDTERIPATSGDLFSATRTSIDAPWSTPQLVSELSSAKDEDCPNLSHDGLTITFASTRGMTYNDLYVATRPTRASPWSPPVRIAELASSGNDEDLTFSDDQLVAMFGSAPPSGGFDLFTTSRPTATSPWNAPLVAGELSTSGNDSDPCLDAAGLTVVFASDRAGQKNDIFIATRPARDMPFSSPVPIDLVNTPDDETDPWLGPDGKTLAFTRGQATARELYIIKLP